MSVWSQVNAGVMCPVSMTYSAVPALRESPELAAEWEPRLTRPSYAGGALAGMAMTEKQGGSDVRANTTRAEPAGDGEYLVSGHKWFCSYPSCDVFLTLAQAPRGLSCLLFESSDPGLSHPAPEGQARHPVDALERGGAPRRPSPPHRRGGTWGPDHHPHGEPHAPGLPDRLGVVHALGAGPGAAPRPPSYAFGQLLVDQPLMRNVLSDLAVESEAATTTVMWVARTYDEQRGIRSPSGASAPRAADREVLDLQARARARG